jgi:hypothetical protein
LRFDAAALGVPRLGHIVEHGLLVDRLQAALAAAGVPIVEAVVEGLESGDDDAALRLSGERRVRAGTSAIKSETYGIDIKHNVPKRALLPGEELEVEDTTNESTSTRARYGDDQNSDSNSRERIYHAFLLRIAEDSKDGSAVIVPEFRLTFVNRGKDNTHLGAAYVCTGCYASANVYFDVHSDLRQERDYYTQLPYYSRFTADKFAPLAHRALHLFHLDEEDSPS